jgi:endonuclease/exonuclease/phosphatase family metal-dependent hydrolase
MMKRLIPALMIFVNGWFLSAEELTVLTWNVESGGSDPAVIGRQLSSLGRFDIIALQEVSDQDAEAYLSGLPLNYDYLISESGSRSNDHLMIIYNSGSLTLNGAAELDSYNGITITPTNHKRSPMIAEFVQNSTGAPFMIITVHLDRSNGEHRALQTFILREWVIRRDIPAIILGDFNFDYNFLEDDPGNPSFKIFTYQDRIRWLKPEKLFDTNYSETAGQETYPDSVLDFIFLWNMPDDNGSRSDIIVRPGDFPDTERTSDHRPVSGSITLP